MRLIQAWFGIALSLSLCGAPASAAIDAKTRDHLRALMNEGGALFEQDQVEAARGKWLEVLQVMPIPAAALWAARANVKLGKLRAAAELYESALAMQPNELWKNDAQQRAQAEAKQEVAALMPRIPTLKFEMDGLVLPDAVTVDGVNRDVAGLTKPQPLDPGTYVVVATRNGKSVTQRVELAEGQQATMKLGFKPEAAPTSPGVFGTPTSPVATTPTSSSGGTQLNAATPTSSRADTRPNSATPTSNRTGTQPDVTATPQTKNSTQQYAMWTSFGIGAAGLIVGTTTGLMLLSKHSSLRDAGCTTDECFDPALQSDMDKYNKLRPISAAGFIVAGVSAAAGLTLWLTKPKQESASSVSMVIGPGILTAQGRY